MLEDFRVHLDLSITMWLECEENVSLNEDAYYLRYTQTFVLVIYNHTFENEW